MRSRRYHVLPCLVGLMQFDRPLLLNRYERRKLCLRVKPRVFTLIRVRSTLFCNGSWDRD